MISYAETEEVKTDTAESKLSASPATFFHNNLRLVEMVADELLSNHDANIEKVSEFLKNLINVGSHDMAVSIIKPRMVKLTQDLCRLILQDKKVETAAMLKKYPGLIFIELELKDAVKDNHERIVIGSPAQVAMATRNMAMLDILQPYIQEKNYQMKFEDIEEVCHLRGEDDQYDKFESLISAIGDEKFIDGKRNETTVFELKQFQDYFNPKGKVYKFNSHISLFDMCRVVFIHLYSSESWSEAQRLLFKEEVVYYLKKLLPVCHAQKCGAILDYLVAQPRNNQQGGVHARGLRCMDLITRETNDIAEKIKQFKQRLPCQSLKTFII